MTSVSQEDLQRFDEKIRESLQRIGGGKVALDSNSVRAAVRSSQDAARVYVEIHCRMATSQPGYLQPAIIVATAYQVEFNDDSLVGTVMRCARELNAMSQLESVGFAPSMDDLKKEPPEREAARQWWKSSSLKEGMCDSCRTPLRRGDGYLIDGRLMMLGKTKLNLGIEVLCRECFEKHRRDPRDPGGTEEDYFRVDS